MWLLTLGVVAWASSVLGRVLGHLESWGPVLNSHQGDWIHPGEARVGWRLPLALRDSQPLCVYLLPSPAGMDVQLLPRCVASGLQYSWGLRMAWIFLFLPLAPGGHYCGFPRWL